MKEVEKSAKTVEEAIQLALEELGTSREEIEVDVLSEGRSGILGVGAEEARIIGPRRLPNLPSRLISPARLKTSWRQSCLVWE
jgi:hypothetical protein